MRDIKFRAWDKKKLLIRQVVDILFEAEAKYNVRLRFPVPGAPQNWELRMFSDVELMQYTGLKDKNGKEIYEGDIVKGGSRYMRHVKKKYAISVIEYRGAGFWVKDEDFGWEGENLWSWDDLEIIGNIYENPELLNSEHNVQASVATEAGSSNKVDKQNQTP